LAQGLTIRWPGARTVWMMSHPPVRFRPLSWLLLILLSHAGLLAWFAFANSAAYDEPAHLAAGVAYWTHGDFEVYALSPPLLRLWTAAPAMLCGAKAPATDAVDQFPLRTRHWANARIFLSANAGRFPFLLVVARLGMIPLSCLAVGIVYCLAGSIFGMRAALPAAALYAFHPFVLANAALVGTDAGVATLMLTTLWLWHRHLRKPSIAKVVFLSLPFAAALLAKTTALLLAPAMLAMAAIVCFESSGGRGKLTLRLLRDWAFTSAVALLIVNAVYGFSGTFGRLADLPLQSQSILAVAQHHPGLRLPLPALYLRGMDAQMQDTEAQHAGGYKGFLFGKVFTGTRWDYYPLTLACKTPLGMWLLLPIAAVGLIACRRAWPLAVAAAVIFAGAAMLTNVDIGLRYLLPLFPLLCVLASVAWRNEWAGRIWLQRLVTGLLCLSIAESLLFCPRFLTYCNVAIAWPGQGWKVLNGADMDWGQGLIDLRQWMADNQVPSVRLAYFGSVDPALYGVNGTLISNPRAAEPLVAVSSYYVVGLTHSADTAHGRVPLAVPFHEKLLFMPPLTVVGNCILIYDRGDYFRAAQPSP